METDEFVTPIWRLLKNQCFHVGTEPSVYVLVADYETLKTEQTSFIKLKLRPDQSLKNRLMLLTLEDELLTDRLFYW